MHQADRNELKGGSLGDEPLLLPPPGRLSDPGEPPVRDSAVRRGQFAPPGKDFSDPKAMCEVPSPDSRDPVGAPLHARKYLLTWNPRTMAWVLGDLTEEQGDKYRSEAMARGPPVPDMSALAQDHELDYLSVSPERYADVRFARAKTQFPLEDPYQPRGGRKEELSQIALGTMPAMPTTHPRHPKSPLQATCPQSSKISKGDNHNTNPRGEQHRHHSNRHSTTTKRRNSSSKPRTGERRTRNHDRYPQQKQPQYHTTHPRIRCLLPQA